MSEAGSSTPFTSGWRPAAPFNAAFTFDARLPGNSNAGHEYGIGLSEPEKTALIEYLKTL